MREIDLDLGVFFISNLFLMNFLIKNLKIIYIIIPKIILRIRDLYSFWILLEKFDKDSEDIYMKY